ncbi:MAG: GDP-mannose 4,6-dehydratase [Verrucomicrobiota bacterium]
MKRALITGILGQDGTYLARWLVAKDYEVHGIIRLPFDREESRITRRFTTEELRRIKFHTATLEDPFSLSHVFKSADPQEVYHLAGVSDSRLSFVVPEQTLNSITLGTLRLLEAGRLQNPAIRYFLASSCEIFGTPNESPQDERTLRQPLTPYGVAKQAADGLAGIYRQKYGQFIAVGILYNHESPLRPANYLSRRVALAVAAIKKGTLQKLTLGAMSAERDWSDARDFVQGFWLSLQVPRSGEYVFASGKSRTVADFVECAFRSAGLNYREFVEAHTANVPTQVRAGLCGNSTKAEKDLGWKRAWTFQRMVEDLVSAEIDGRQEIERANPLRGSP